MKQEGIEENDFALLYEEGPKVGLHLIFSANKSFFTSSVGLSGYLRERIDTALIAMKMVNQTIFTRSSSVKEKELPIDQAYLHYHDAQTRIKITK